MNIQTPPHFSVVSQKPASSKAVGSPSSSTSTSTVKSTLLPSVDLHLPRRDTHLRAPRQATGRFRSSRSPGQGTRRPSTGGREPRGRRPVSIKYQEVLLLLRNFGSGGTAKGRTDRPAKLSVAWTASRGGNSVRGGRRGHRRGF